MTHPFAHAREAYRQAAALDVRLSPHADLALERIGELGRGGMGAVYRVRDLRLPGREAALKVMLEAGDGDGARRFQREAEITARLEHPSIPPVYEAGIMSSGHPYLLMRLISGKTLEQEIEALHAGQADLESAPAKRLLEALLKVSEAIAYAHGEGVIHRDLKPENVMLGPFGEVLVMDWGLARSREDARAEASGAGLTQEGTTMGTPGYMPPEQAGGDPVDERADVFALGAILVEILTGKAPITGPTATNKITATLQGKIELPRDRRADAPRELHSLAAAALAAEPDERLGSAIELADDLRAYLQGELLRCHTYGSGERVRRWARRHPVFLLSMTLAAFVLAGGSGLVAQQSMLARAQAETAAAAAAQAREEEERKREAAAKERLERILTLLQAASSSAGMGDAETTRKRVEEVLALGGRSAQLLLACARVHERSGDYEEALRHVEEALKEHPEDVELHFAKHTYTLLRGHEALFTSSAMGGMEALSKRWPEQFGAYLRAWRALLAGEPRRALSELEGAEENFFVCTARARAHLELDQAKEAEAYATRAIAMHPRAGQPRMIRALARMKLEDVNGAWEDADGAVQLGAVAADAYRVRAFVHMRRHDLKRAIADLDAALSSSPNSADLLSMRALIRFQAGQHELAFADAEKALARDPKSADALYARGNVYWERDQAARALEDFERFVALRPKTMVAYEARGNAYLSLNRFEDAERDFDHALKLSPDEANLYLFRGQARIALKRYPEAKEDLVRVLQLDPKHPERARVERTLARLREMGF